MIAVVLSFIEIALFLFVIDIVYNILFYISI